MRAIRRRAIPPQPRPTDALTGRVLAFFDEFPGQRLDPRKWTLEPPFSLNGGFAANASELQANVPEGMVVANGQLSIKVRKVSPQVYSLDYTSGCPTSYGKFSQSYGRWEIRAKMPSFVGQWPSFWLLPADPLRNQNDSQLPEIDVFEMLGNHDALSLTYRQVGGSNTGITVSGLGFRTGMHTFAVEWDAGVATWFIDDVQRHSAFTNIGAEPLYMLLQVAVGGSGGTPVDDTALPAQMDVEYIRIYERESPIPAGPKISTISDSFQDGVVSSLWRRVADTGTVNTEIGGRLSLRPYTSGPQHVWYAYYETVDRYDLSDSAVYVRVEDVATTVSATGFTRLFLANQTHKYQVYMRVVSGALDMCYRSAGAETIVATVTYAPATHVWWRIREASGTLYYDTSVDGSSWTNRGSVATPFVVTAMRCQLAAYTTDSITTPSPIATIFSNFNETADHPFIPSDLTSQLWAPAYGITGLNDGDAISSFADAGTHGYTVQQGTGANQPLYKTAIKNGKPVIRFDGTNDYLFVNNTVAHGIGTGDFTFYAAVKASGASGAYRTIASNGVFSPAFYVHSSHPHMYWGADKAFSTSLSSNTWYLLCFQRSGTTVRCYVNGVLDATTFTISTSMADAVWQLGNDTSSSYFGGDMLELTLHSTAHSAGERASMEAYFNAKYNIF